MASKMAYSVGQISLFLLVSSCLINVGSGTATLTVESQEMGLTKGDSGVITYRVSGSLTEAANISMDPVDKRVFVDDYSSEVWYLEGGPLDEEFNLTVETNHEGIVTLTPNSYSEEIDVSNAFVIVSVMRDPTYETVAIVLGWVSTVAWDISFIPQIWHNYRRHSVEGLSFDFLTFNLLGFSCYFVFNAGMLWIPAIKDEFALRHPNEVLHVRLNDVIFPMYAVICTAIQIVQCFFYPRAPGQQVSWPCRIISALLLVVVIIACILAPTVGSIFWLDTLYLMSYVKLFISMIKYTPQLYTNYKAKSTAGWSIGQVILDFTGGLMSIIQMTLLAANYDDFNSMLTDPTKLGLGLLSIFFNIFFFIQHYALYKGNDIEDVRSVNVVGKSKGEDAFDY